MNTTFPQTLSQRLQERLKKSWRAHLTGVDREEARAYVRSIGSLTPAFVFLVVISCAIVKPRPLSPPRQPR